MVLKQVGRMVGRNLPTIITVAGAVGVIAGGVLACKATLKLDSVVTEHNLNVEVVRESGYSDIKLYRKAMFQTYGETVIKFARLYGPAIIVTSLSLGGIFYGHNILRARNIALVGAYKALVTDYSGFKDRVEERLGHEERVILEHDMDVIEVEEETADGKTEKKKVVVVPPEPEVPGNEHAKFFCESSIYWKKNPEENLNFLRDVEKRMQEKFSRQGYLFLNDVYDELDIPRTYGGSVCGWIKGLGDNIIDFGIYDTYRESARRFVNGLEPVILLDFNHDGYIADKI